jgi:hypothetical protein
LTLDFLAEFFGKLALKKIQDGNRFKISFQKSIERKILLQTSLFSQCFRLQAHVKKFKCKNVLRIYNFFCWNQRTHGSESGYGWIFSQIFTRMVWVKIVSKFVLILHNVVFDENWKCTDIGESLLNRNDPKSEQYSLDLQKRVIPKFQSVWRHRSE